MLSYINNSLDYYVKILIFFQSSKISKLRFVNIFGKNYLMINYIFYKDNGYLFDNRKIV